MANELTAEIMAVGKWNGMEFTLDTLNGIASAFEELKNNLDVALKFGHNDKQPMTDGKPALGWVDKVWVEGDKLLAHYIDLPKIVYNAVKKKLYKNVSVELEFDVNYKGKNYPAILTGVALLGADIPAVNTLEDLTHYMNRDAAFSVGRSMAFSTIAGSIKEGGNTMSDQNLEQLTKAVADLTAQVALLSAGKATVEAANIGLTAKVAQFEAERQAITEASLTKKIADKRDQVKTMLEDAVKSEAITPAQRDQFTRIVHLDDDKSVEALDIEEVKKFTNIGSRRFSRPAGKGANDATHDEDGYENVPLTVANGIKDIQAKGEAKTFADAQVLFFNRNPALARAYVDFNGR